MTELHENHFWHRRITQVAIALSLLVIILYVLSFLKSGELLDNISLQIGILPALLAGITLIAAVLSILLTDKRIHYYMPAIVQCSMIVTAMAVIHTTDGLYSYFLALWIPAVIFVGVFGARGLIATGAVPLMYAIWLYATDIFTLPMAVTTLLVGEVPVLLSSLLFSHLAVQKEETSYKQLATQFTQVSDKAEVVINAITNGVIALDKHGTIELINPAAQRLIGWESRDAIKLDYKSVLKLVDKNSNEVTSANDPILKVLSTNEEIRTEDYKLITNAGKKIMVSIVASPVGQQGSGVIIVFRDITKEKTEEREQAEFISTASHEMRTPVAAIEGYLGLALNPNTAQIDEKARGYIMKAQEVAQHLGRLFQDLLDVSKAEDGRLSNNPRTLEVVSFVKDIVEGLRPKAEAKGLIMLYKPVPDNTDDKADRRINPVYYANVDNDHFREVISNLIENAIKYTKDGTVSIDISGDEKQITISIQDTGIGIPVEDLPHLFQKFYRVDNSDTREIGGTGLGLFLSRRLVEVMDGRIWAESQQGQGSTFHVSIPRISHQEAMQLIEAMGDEPIATPAAPELSLDMNIDLPTLDMQPSGAPSSNVLEIPTTDPSTPQMTYSGPFTPQIASNPDVSAQPNTPSGPTLAAIESNPSAYLSRSSLTVPQRSPRNPSDTQNQT